MTFNFSELQQKIDRLLYNIAEQNRRAYQLFYDPTPRDVELPQLDENGNLTTIRIPNRAKIKAEVDSFISRARGEYPLVNVHFNSRLVCSNGADENGLYIPDGYSYHADLIDVAELIPVREVVSNPENDRHPIEKEFLDFVFGNHDNYRHYPDFNILHVKTKPKSTGMKWFIYTFIASVPVCTYRTFIKVISGRLYISCAGVFDATNEWKLIEVHTGSNYGIWDEHRLDHCNDGEVLEYYFAYPTVLMGHVSLPKSVVTIKQIKTEW